MSNREALRDLQTRLTAKLQAARTENLGVSSWLAVEAGGQRYLLPLAQSGEIFGWPGVQSVPYTQPWFLGVANLRGALVGLVDLAGFLGNQRPAAERNLLESSVVSVNSALDINVGFVVDRLAGLRSLDGFVDSEVLSQAGAPDFQSAVYIDAQGQRWQELNLQRLAATPAFLSISA